jgi:hypothetical protein
MFDVCGDAVFAGNFEEAERQFMERFLKPNMIVLKNAPQNA